MRSFIKSHKKNDSSTTNVSSTEYMLDQPSTEYQAPISTTKLNLRSTPLSSPKVQQIPSYTPPSNTAPNASISSPKKLLTPIKNLFSSSQAKTVSTPTSNDSLHSVIGLSPKETKGPKFLKHKRSKSYLFMTSDDMYEDPKNTNLHPKPKFKSSLSSPTLGVLPLLNEEQAIKDAHFHSHEINNVQLGPPIDLSPRLHNSAKFEFNSNNQNPQSQKKVSIAKSNDSSVHEDKFSLIENSSDENGQIASESDSESSSQFSFVRDMKAGRNTSVKYYKTKSNMNQNVELNLLNDQFDDYGENEYSDYDYDNNGGLDDYESDYFDEAENDVNYNSILQETNDDVEQGILHKGQLDDAQILDSEQNSRLVNTEDIAPQIIERREENFVLQPSLFNNNNNVSIKPFNGSYHLSIQGPLTEIQSSDSVPNKSNFEEDILENYLESKSPSSRSNSESKLETISNNASFELFDLSSPIINGLTVGQNLRHRSKEKSDVNPNRLFIHRNPICFDEFTDKTNQEILKQRYARAFHESIEDFNLIIPTKLEEYENFCKRYEIEKDSFSVSNKEEKDCEYNSTVDEPRFSISNMMKMLSNLESSVEPVVLESGNTSLPKSANNPRTSVLGMMDFLANVEHINQIENSTEEVKPSKVVTEDNTMINVNVKNMPALPNSELKDSKINNLKNDAVSRKASFKRYSWFDSQESLNIKQNQMKEIDPTDDNEKHNNSLDQDIIDEINQVPDDFDFGKNDNENDFVEKNYFRSNSFKRMPQKSAYMNDFTTNKIETKNKTVTLYKNSTKSLCNVDRLKSVSRGPSVRSCASFLSVQEDDEESYFNY